MKIGDSLVLLAGLALIAWLGWQTWGSGPGNDVIIYVNAERYATWPLDQNRQIRISGVLGPSIIRIKNGAVRFISSPCNHKYCLRAGWLEYAGAATACLPNQVSLLVTSQQSGKRDYDAINF